jgi:uncharacterized protein YndB with AHSA1/START domain
MSALVSAIEIDRRPEEVFPYATDPAHFADWQPDVVEARAVDAGPPEVGSRLRQTRRIGRTQRSFSQEVVELDPPRKWVVRGTDGPIRPGMDLTVEPLGVGDRTRVTFALDFDPRGIGRVLVPLLVRRLARRNAPRSYQNLKELLEDPEPPAPSDG